MNSNTMHIFNFVFQSLKVCKILLSTVENIMFAKLKIL